MYSRDSDFDLVVPRIPVGQGDAGVLEEMDLAAVSASHGEYTCLRRLSVKRLFFIVDGVAVNGATTISFKRRPTPGSATGEVEIGVLNVPDALAIGKVLYKDIKPVEIGCGESIEISHVQNLGGQGFARADLEPHQETLANSPNSVEDKS